MNKDLAEGQFIMNWPKWLRWILFMPTAVLGSILSGVLYLLLTNVSGFMFGFTSEGYWWQLVSSGIMGFLFVYLGTWMAPNFQEIVSLLLLVLLVVIAALMTILSLSVETTFGLIGYFILIIVMVSSALYAVYVIRED